MGKGVRMDGLYLQMLTLFFELKLSVGFGKHLPFVAKILSIRGIPESTNKIYPFLV
jgi:hypothetical protein